MKTPTCVILLFIALLPIIAHGQEVIGEEEPSELPAVAVAPELRVDTVSDASGRYLSITVPTVQKYPPMVFANERERREYGLLVRRVKKVLPYAVQVRYIVLETYIVLDGLPESERKAHINRVKRELNDQYGRTIRKMSKKEGQLLIKLIDRECNQTGYDIVRAFIGSFKASIYQGLARLFGQNLKKRYDPEGDDKMLERVVRMVESGQL
ncbi:MAG: DUF4294 domain-containing protein [Bacteroidaceae bacterium]|nr:DUF4294 domain-containing protein [Bacteroidaceae bacterium]MBR7028423.1 DUF4294 domain-containing protein [Bacteroidaceae bacterium]